jgi:hypothetical protein
VKFVINGRKQYIYTTRNLRYIFVLVFAFVLTNGNAHARHPFVKKQKPAVDKSLVHGITVLKQQEGDDAGSKRKRKSRGTESPLLYLESVSYYNNLSTTIIRIFAVRQQPSLIPENANCKRGPPQA